VDQAYRIQIKLAFDIERGMRLPVWLLLSVVRAADNAILASERNDLQLLRHRMPNIPDVAFDAAERRIADFRGAALQLERAQEGSIVLIGVAAGLSVFLLQNTVGETMKEAWLESDTHRRLKAFLLEQRHFKPNDIAKRLVSRLGRASYVGGRVQTSIETAPDGASQINVHVSGRDYQPGLPPPREELRVDRS
jgi:hypothetical protein